MADFIRPWIMRRATANVGIDRSFEHLEAVVSLILKSRIRVT